MDRSRRILEFLSYYFIPRLLLDALRAAIYPGTPRILLDRLGVSPPDPMRRRRNNSQHLPLGGRLWALLAPSGFLFEPPPPPDSENLLYIWGTAFGQKPKMALMALRILPDFFYHLWYETDHPMWRHHRTLAIVLAAALALKDFLTFWLLEFIFQDDEMSVGAASFIVELGTLCSAAEL